MADSPKPSPAGQPGTVNQPGTVGKAPKANHNAGGKAGPGDQLRANLKKRKAQSNSRANSRANNQTINQTSNKTDDKSKRTEGS